MYFANFIINTVNKLISNCNYQINIFQNKTQVQFLDILLTTLRHREFQFEIIQVTK